MNIEPSGSTLCSAEITFKTDPKNTDYLAEHGASRNFEPWREEKELEEEDRLAKLEAEENNPMKALENRTVDSKREMDILDALQDIRARNARNEKVDDRAIQEMLAGRLDEEELEPDEEALEREKWEEEDEKLVRQVFDKVDAGGDKVTLKRKAAGETPDLLSLLSESSKAAVGSAKAAAASTSVGPPPAKRPRTTANGLGIKPVRRKPAV